MRLATRYDSRTRTRSAEALSLVLLLASCASDAPEPAEPGIAERVRVVADDSVRVSLDASTAAPTPGDTVWLAASVPPEPVAIGGVQGSISFDPTSLRWIGQAPVAATLAVVNRTRAGDGSLRVGALDVTGIAGEFLRLAFVVLRDDGLRSVRWHGEVAASTYGDPVPIAMETWISGVRLLPRLDPRMMDISAWEELLYGPSHESGINALPGQYVLNLRYGDVTLDGLINIIDASRAANAGVGNLPLLTPLDRDYAIAGDVFPANLPGLGEVGDDRGPGVETDGGHVINIIDAVNIANEGIGNDRPVVGELIPGRGPLATERVIIADSIGTSRTLYSDTIYVLNGPVIVSGGATLAIEPGTVIEGDRDTRGGLLVRRGANIEAVGTRLAPIIFRCSDPAGGPGCWRGVTIAGFALLNATVQSADLNLDITCPQKPVPGFPGQFYGGCIDGDNSGHLRYVRIENAGALPDGSPAPSLSLLGLGEFTIVDSVQVLGSGGDGIFIGGGDVRLRNVLASNSLGAGVSWHEGWIGKIQFLIVHQPAGGSHALLARGEGKEGARPRLFHATLVSQSATAATISVRDSANVDLGDVVVLATGAPALEIVGERACLQAVNGLTPGTDLVASVFSGPMPLFAGGSDCDAGAFALDPIRGNRVGDPMLIAPLNTTSPDYRPAFGSPLSSGWVAPPLNGSFFRLDQQYVGAVPPAPVAANTIPWYAGWTVGW